MAYDSQCNNGAPNGYGYQPGPAQTLEIKQREKRQIRKLGNISGPGHIIVRPVPVYRCGTAVCFKSL